MIPRTQWQDAEARIIACYASRHSFHGGFEIFMDRLDEKPLSQKPVRGQCWEFGLNGSVMLEAGTDQNPMPLPAAGFRWLNQQQHLTLEEVRGKPAEHALSEEGGVLGKRLENPLMLELLHFRCLRDCSFSTQSSSSSSVSTTMRCFNWTVHGFV